MAQYWAAYQVVDDVSPTFERAQAWLEANRPARPRRRSCTATSGMGNVIVETDGLQR